MSWPVLLFGFLVAPPSGAYRPTQSPETVPSQEEDTRPAPVLVTEATRRDEKALAELEKPGDILCSDGFESADSLKKFFEIRGLDDGRARIELDEKDADARPGGAMGSRSKLAHSGSGALRLAAPANDGKSSGAGATYWLGDEGFPRLHLRYYLKFAADYDQGNLNHTGGSLAGVAGDDKWAGMGGAGLRPKGDDDLSTRFETWRDWGRVAAPGYAYLYTYWMDMKRDRDGHFWGNMLGPQPAERFVPERDVWHCYELMVRVNDVGAGKEGPAANGELAAWIDGTLYVHYKGIRWRSSPAVLLKRFDLGVYVHQATHENAVWFDDVVVSTGYIGPMH